MGRGGFGRGTHDKELSRIVNGDYKYLIVLIPKNRGPNQTILGDYELFEELDEQKIKDYANQVAEWNSVHEKVEFSGAKVFSLEVKALPFETLIL